MLQIPTTNKKKHKLHDTGEENEKRIENFTSGFASQTQIKLESSSLDQMTASLDKKRNQIKECFTKVNSSKKGWHSPLYLHLTP
jgi:hypothetical protein